MSSESIIKLLKTVAGLRDPQTGCPWDLEQNHESLMPYFFEEIHEFAESLKTVGPQHPHTLDELGDVLYQVLIHVQLMQEQGSADFNKLCEVLNEKLVRRHPHVFDPSFPKFKTSAEVNQAWEQIKVHAKKSSSAAIQKNEKNEAPASVLQSVPSSLPSLQRSARIGEKASSLGFDWPDSAQVWEKVREELKECEEARDIDHEKEELGDLLFALAQYARKKKLDPEDLLRAANEKFVKRFEKMEAKLRENSSKKFNEFTLEEMEAAWVAIKRE